MVTGGMVIREDGMVTPPNMGEPVESGCCGKDTSAWPLSGKQSALQGGDLTSVKALVAKWCSIAGVAWHVAPAGN